MARSAATNRTAATNRVAATNRTAITAARLPIALTDMGMTNYWDFRTGYIGDDSTSVTDMIGGLDLQLKDANTATAYTTGQYNVLLDGVDDHLVTAEPYGEFKQKSTTNESIGAWIRLEANPVQNGGIFGLWAGNNKRHSLLTFRNTDRTAVDVRYWGSVNGITNGHRTTSSTIDFSTFHSVVGTFNSGVMKLYIDGVEVSGNDSSVPATLFSPSAVSITFGCWLTSSQLPTNHVNATIGHCFRAGDVTLTDQNVLDWHNWSQKVQGL